MKNTGPSGVASPQGFIYLSFPLVTGTHANEPTTFNTDVAKKEM